MLKRILAVAAACLLASCGGQGNEANKAEAPAASAGQGVSGAGATFPAPLYARWAADYKAATGTEVNYQPIGSGGGVKQITAGTIDFGGTDKPLSAEDLAKADLVQFPTVLGGITPVVNLPGVASDQIKLTGAQLADIFSGEIKTWRDPRLAQAAGGAPLPNLPITVVHRSDASGTSFVFTNYLSLKSPTWKSKVGAADAVEWPVGIGGKGNDGVAVYVRQTVGAVGYVEYSFAKETNLTTVQLQGHDGAFVAPTAETFSAAAANADWAAAPAFNLLLLDQPGANAWPITAATFVLVHKIRNPDRAAEVVKFFEWTQANGDATAAKLAYVPLPASLKTMVQEVWRRDIGAAAPAAKP